MPNRLEQEFPRTSWRAVSPIGPRSLDQEVVRRYLERGRKLRGQAIRNGVRDAIAAVVRGSAAVVCCAAHGQSKRPPEGDCCASAAHGA